MFIPRTVRHQFDCYLMPASLKIASRLKQTFTFLTLQGKFYSFKHIVLLVDFFLLLTAEVIQTFVISGARAASRSFSIWPLVALSIK